MATLTELNRTLHARFRYQRRQFRRSLKITSHAEAENVVHRVKYTLGQLASGRLVVPENVDPADFIVNGGVLIAPPTIANVAEPSTTLRSVIQEYQANRF